VTPIHLERNISRKLLELETSNLVGGFVLGMPSRRTNNFPESGPGLCHVTPTIFGSTVGYPSDGVASCYFYCYKNRFLADRTNGRAIIGIHCCVCRLSSVCDVMYCG